MLAVEKGVAQGPLRCDGDGAWHGEPETGNWHNHQSLVESILGVFEPLNGKLDATAARRCGIN
jgi:hypothetical protein